MSLEVRNISYGYSNERDILRNVSFKLEHNSGVFPASVVDTIMMGIVAFSGNKIRENDKKLFLTLLKKWNWKSLHLSI